MGPWDLMAFLILILLPEPAEAQNNRFRVSMGYAFAQYLEDGGGSAPLGAYLSVASPGERVGIEADLAYHRDSEDLFFQTIVLHTVTVALGPRLESGDPEKTRSYFHLLGALRHDSVEGVTNTSYGGMAGLGADLPLGSGIFVRAGADFQIFFDEGQNLKVFRLNAGLGF